MRRYSFFIGAASAVLTFIALSAFTGRRPWNREARWPYGWQRHHCDREGRFNDEKNVDSPRWRRGYDRPVTPIDSTGREFSKPTDSTGNR